MVLSSMVSITVHIIQNMALASTSKIVSAVSQNQACSFLRVTSWNRHGEICDNGDKAEDMMAAEAAGVGTKILVRTGKPVTEQGEAIATVVLDSIADVPAYLNK